jgi:ribosomal protein S18 acetylase RimI-like enzyme
MVLPEHRRPRIVPGSVCATRCRFSVAVTDAVCQDPSVIAVQELGPGDWMLWRALRIEATTTEPDAFGSTIDEVVATTEPQWRARLAEPSLHLVARHGNVAVGMAAVHHDFELGSVWVRPTARGCGAGHRLIEAALRWAASREAPLVHLAVRETNAAAISLYRTHGFVEVGEDYLNPERVHRLILMARASEDPQITRDPNHHGMGQLDPSGRSSGVGPRP